MVPYANPNQSSSEIHSDQLATCLLSVNLIISNNFVKAQMSSYVHKKFKNAVIGNLYNKV